jgi:uncharacterized protein (TIRG00374 family)
MLGVLGYEIQWLAPHISAAGHALSDPRWWWVAFAVWAELSSVIAFARLQRIMLRPGGVRVPLRRAVSVAFAANAMSVTLPGGSIISSAWTYRRMRSWGASNALVGFGLVASGALSTLALGVIAVLGTTLAGSHPSPWTLIAEITAAVVVAILLRRLVRRPDLVLRLAHSGLGWINRVRRRALNTGHDSVQAFLDELILIKPRRRDWLYGVAFASVNWLLDLVCLIASCRAVGINGHLLGVAIVAYVAGTAASSLSVLPGGLGVVDGALILGLTQGGLPTGAATAGVLVYRLISLVLVVLIGWCTWWLLQRSDQQSNADLRSSAGQRQLEDTP